MRDAIVYDHFDLNKFKRNSINKFKLSLLSDQLGDSIQVPMVVVRGKTQGPRVTITAAIHGDEINGAFVCFNLIDNIKPEDLAGDLVLIPIVNVMAFKQNRRQFPGPVDLNRVMPGIPNGLPGEQFAFHFFNEAISGTDFLFDLHTASRGRVNTLYTRVNLNFKNNKELALLQRTPIILNTLGPEASLRTAAEAEGAQALTIEIGNPNIYQKEHVDLALNGILDTLSFLEIYKPKRKIIPEEKIICQSSEWLRTTSGGLIEINTELYQVIEKGECIGIIRDAFGNTLEEYRTPHRGIVIGKETNPVCISGDRLIHLGKL